MGRNQFVRGLDCFPKHDLDTICSGNLCQHYLETVAMPEQCPSEHAHPRHYLVTDGLHQRILACAGRDYCDPKFMAPS